MTSTQTFRDMDPNVTMKQIGTMALMCVGAHKITGYKDALQMKVRILPYKKDGTRSDAPRIMTLTIKLGGDDLYWISVAYPNRGQLVTHFQAEGIYAEDLGRLFDDLDLGKEKGWA